VTMSRDIFGVHGREEGSYGHLAGRHAAKYLTVYRSAPFLPVQERIKNYLAPNVSAEVIKPCSRGGLGDSVR